VQGLTRTRKVGRKGLRDRKTAAAGGGRGGENGIAHRGGTRVGRRLQGGASCPPLSPVLWAVPRVVVVWGKRASQPVSDEWRCTGMGEPQRFIVSAVFRSEMAEQQPFHRVQPLLWDSLTEVAPLFPSEIPAYPGPPALCCVPAGLRNSPVCFALSSLSPFPFSPLISFSLPPLLLLPFGNYFCVLLGAEHCD
jgi:hypothetical protein